MGRFIQPDTIVPNPYNPQDLNRYSYVRNNPLRYTDPSGHCPVCVGVIAYAKLVALNVAVDTSIDFLIAKVTGDKFYLGDSVKTNLVIDAATAGVGGKIAKSGKVAALAEKVFAKHGDDVAKVAGRLGLSKFFGKEVPEEAIERGLRKFSEGSFRENLRRVTGKTAEEIAGKEAHHVLPQKYRELLWNKVGIDVDDPTFGAWVAKNPKHQQWTHAYEREWDKFFNNFERENIFPTQEEVLGFAQGLAKEYEFNVLFTVD